MKYISDVMYYMDKFPSGNVYNIVNDLTPLSSGQDDFLDGCVVQMLIGNKQLIYNDKGGKFNQGYLTAQNNTGSTNTNTKFLMQWAGYGGYYLWPMNGDKQIQMFANVDDGTINGSLNGEGMPSGKYELINRVYKLTNIKMDGGPLNLVVNLTVGSKFGNFTLGLDGNNVKVGAGTQPANITITFIKFGTKAWQLLMAKDFNIAARCCFPANSMTSYDNFTTACESSGYKDGTDLCNGVVPQACRNIGYEDQGCANWCKLHPALCYDSINGWCNDSTKNNLNKSVCACFNTGKFELFKKDFTKNCKAPCKISDFTAGCFLPACLASGMKDIANQGKDCPPNTSIYQNCIQKLTNEIGSNVSADKIVMLCKLNAGEVDTENPVDDKGGNTIAPGGNTNTPGSGNTNTPSGNTNVPGSGNTIASDGIPKPTTSNGIGDFFAKYQLYIIIGAVILVFLIGIAMFVAFKK